MMDNILTFSNTVNSSLKKDSSIELKLGLALDLLTIRELKVLAMSIKRNDICLCGSGKKFKKCHMDMFLEYYSRRLH